MTASAGDFRKHDVKEKNGTARLPGLAFLLVLMAVLTVAGSADDKHLSSAGISAIAPARATALPEGTRVASIRLSDGDRYSERLSGLPGLSNVGRVAPGILRGGQPDAKGYETLKKMGIRTVINLRAEYDEREEVEAAGMRMVHIPINAEDLKRAAVREAVSVMVDPNCQPVYIHCDRGRRRTGFAVAVYRIELDGWSTREAASEMEVFGVSGVINRIKEFLEGNPEKSIGLQ